MADGPSTSSPAVSAMSKLNRLGCPPMPAFQRGSTSRRDPRWSRGRSSDSDSFNPYEEAVSCPVPRVACRRKRRPRVRSAACPCCVQVPPPPCCEGFQRMEVVPGLWYQLEDAVGSGKQAWHWIGDPAHACSVLAPLSAVPLGARSRPRAPPPQALLHMAVFPAAVFSSMLRDANRVLCMVAPPPPDSIGAWYSVDEDGEGDAAPGKPLDVTLGRASSCEPWYTLPPGATTPHAPGGDSGGCWIWFPVPPHDSITVAGPGAALLLLHEHYDDDVDEPLVLGRWMTETLRSA